MNTTTPERPPFLPSTDAATEALHGAVDSAKAAAHNAASSVNDAAHQAVDSAKHCCQSMTVRAEHSMVRAQECMRRNPMKVVLGSVAFGIAAGCLLSLIRREQPTLRQRFADDPIQATRDRLYAALAPVAHHLHDGFVSARDGASKAMNGLHRANDSWAHQIGRAGSHLKFW